MEGHLSRQLDIRFIDARELVNEAKLALGITGYASKDQEPLVMQHALHMFENLPKTEQEKMHQMNGTLMTIKSIHSQNSSISGMMMHGAEDTTDCSVASHCTRKSGSRKGWLRRTFSIDP
jgi:phosphoribosylformylglycinamidine (FGAM) synthase-like amidotransferase family enzyme